MKFYVINKSNNKILTEIERETMSDYQPPANIRLMPKTESTPFKIGDTYSEEKVLAYSAIKDCVVSDQQEPPYVIH